MTSTSTPRPPLAGIGVVVADMAATLAFYGRLGLAFPAGAQDQPHVETELPGRLRLMFDTIETIHSFDPGWQTPTGGHRVALAFACPSSSEVDTVHAELVAAGHVSHLDPFDAPWGQRYAAVFDPDGNPVEFFAPLG